MDLSAHDDRDRPSPDWKLPPEPPVHRAARRGDIAELHPLVEAGADLDETADLEFDNGPHLRGLTPLMVAARSIDGATIETLRWLLEHGADLTARSEGGNTAAWYAAGHGGRWEFHKKAVTPDHAERLRFLLDQGLDPHECNFIGRSLITEACEASDAARLRLLLDRRVTITPAKPTTERPTLMERLNATLDIDSDVAALDVPKGDLDSFQIPLFCASRSGSSECVKLVLDAGADPNTRDSSGGTALMVAGTVDTVQALLDAGADLHATDEFGKDAFETLLEGACDSGACGPERLHVARALVDAGVNIERVDRFGKSRLASAAFGHHDDAVTFLLELGANPLALDTEGGTPLHSICWQGEYQDDDTNAACARIIETLVQSGVAVDAANSRGMTSLHEAAHGDWGNPTAIRTLLRLGASPDPEDDDGDTPLMLAASNGETDCIRLLLEAGANPMQKNHKGRTPIDAAKNHLGSWESIAAAGPDESLDAMIKQMERAVAEEMATEFGEAQVDYQADDSIDATSHQDEVLADARKSFDLLVKAAAKYD